MSSRPQLSRRLRLSAAVLLAVPALWFLLPLFAPFLAGFLISAAAAPAARCWGKRLPRASSVLAACAVFLCAAVLWLGARQGMDAVLTALPVLLPQLREGLAQALTGLLPADVFARLFSAAESLIRAFSSVLRILYRLTAADAAAGILIFVSAILFSLQPDTAAAWLRCRFPRFLLLRWDALKGTCAQAIRSWCSTELPRFFLFLSLCWGAFSLLDVPFAWLFAPAVALFELFPVVGAGWVLLPAAFCTVRLSLLPLTLSLLTLYAIAVLLRLAFDRGPKKPTASRLLQTLVAGYAGYRLAGSMGLLLLPCIAALLRPVLAAARKVPASQS